MQRSMPGARRGAYRRGGRPRARPPTAPAMSSDIRRIPDPVGSPHRRGETLADVMVKSLVPAALDLRALRALPFATVCVVVSGLGHSLGGGGTVPLSALLIGGLVVWAAATALAGRERSLRAIAGGLAVGQLGLHLYFHETMTAGTAGSMAGMPGMASGTAGSGGSSALLALALRLICGPGTIGTSTLPPGTTAGEIVSRAGIDPHLLVTVAPQLSFWSHWTHSAFLGLTPLMLVCHLAAAVVIGWWLRRGEAAVWQLARTGVQLAETLARRHTAPLRTVLALAAALLRGLPGEPGDGPDALRAAVDRADRRLPRAALLRHQVVRRGPPALLTT
jgi:hypothetical protein